MNDERIEGGELSRLVESTTGMRKGRDRQRAIGATLAALHAALAEDDARALSLHLPKELSALLERCSTVTVRSAADLYAQVERLERHGRGFAVEHAQAVLGALAHALKPEVADRLRRHLPADIAALLRPPADYPDPPAHVHLHPERQAPVAPTLSRARPPTNETIAEARGPLAHSRSVVRTVAAYADRMLETARSTRPGKEDETFASTRHPPSRR